MATQEEKQKHRSQLAAKMEKDIEDFVSQLKPKKYEDGWPEDKWEEEMEKHPIFRNKPFEEGQELPPMVEAMQQLKYDPDENTPEELAKSFKDDGNNNFRVNKYRWAVDSYTEGLKCKCKDEALNGQLYSNRGAAHFHIGNYKKALNDASEAKTLIPGYLKAIILGARCCLHLELYDECVSWCDDGLKVYPKDSVLDDIKEKAVKAKKLAERDRRKAASREEKRKKELASLLNSFKERGINFDVKSVDSDTLEPTVEQLSSYRVHFDDSGCLVWPVLFLYPEYQVTDSVIHFHENSLFVEQLSLIFSPDDTPSWDTEEKYKVDTLQVYFGHQEDGKLIEVKMDQSLKTVLQDKRYIVRGGVPSFFVTVKNSKFDSTFRKNNGMST